MSFRALPHIFLVFLCTLIAGPAFSSAMACDISGSLRQSSMFSSEMVYVQDDPGIHQGWQYVLKHPASEGFILRLSALPAEMLISHQDQQLVERNESEKRQVIILGLRQSGFEQVEEEVSSNSLAWHVTGASQSRGQRYHYVSYRVSDACILTGAWAYHTGDQASSISRQVTEDLSLVAFSELDKSPRFEPKEAINLIDGVTDNAVIGILLLSGYLISYFLTSALTRPMDHLGLYQRIGSIVPISAAALYIAWEAAEIALLKQGWGYWWIPVISLLMVSLFGLSVLLASKANIRHLCSCIVSFTVLMTAAGTLGYLWTTDWMIIWWVSAIFSMAIVTSSIARYRRTNTYLARGSELARDRA